MAVYKDFKLTNKGIDLFAELLQGSGEMEFRYLAAGSGSYAEGESSDEYIRGMGSLKEERQRVPFTSVKKMDDGMVSLKADLSNQGLTESYLMTEVGIYAGIAGSEESVLYCVTTPESPDYMPDFSAGRLYNVVFRTLISIGDAEDITVVYTPDNYVSKEEFQDALKGKVDVEEGKGLSSNDYTDQDKKAVDGLPDALKGKVDVEEGKGLSANDYTDQDKKVVDGLNGLGFGQDENGSWGYKAPGSQVLVPFGAGEDIEEAARFERIVIGTHSNATYEADTVLATFPENFEYKWGQVFVEIIYSAFSNWGTIKNHTTGMVFFTDQESEFKIPLEAMFFDGGRRLYLQRMATIQNARNHTEISAGAKIIVSGCSSYNFHDGTWKEGTENEIYLVPRACFLSVKNRSLRYGQDWI